MARHDEHDAEPPPAKPRWSWRAIFWTCWWAGWTLLFLAMSVFQWTGLDPQPDYEAAEGGVILAFLTGALALTGVFRLRERPRSSRPIQYRPSRKPRIQVEKKHLLPRPGSTARQPMRQLTDAEHALAELLRQLGDLPNGPDEDVIQQAWRAATDAAARLREIGARLAAVELAAVHGSPQERTTFEDAVSSLRTHLEQGLDAYRSLVSAAGRLMLATPVEATDELVEATESLAGLAEAWHELTSGEE